MKEREKITMLTTIIIVVAIYWVCPKFCVNTEMRCK